MIIKLDETHPLVEFQYDNLEKWLKIGYDYLPFFFLKKVYHDNEVTGEIDEAELPRWISNRHFNTIDEDTRNLMMKLNWE